MRGLSEQFTIRLASANDFDALGEVMYDAVRNGPSAYTETQRQAWVPQPRTGEDWYARLATQTIFVGLEAEQIVGFMSLSDGGYVDLAFIRPAARGRGLFRHLYEKIEQAARQSGQPRLWTHASLTAQPAFTAMGFTTLRREVVTLRGESFERAEMHNVAEQ